MLQYIDHKGGCTKNGQYLQKGSQESSSIRPEKDAQVEKVLFLMMESGLIYCAFWVSILLSSYPSVKSA